MTSSGTTGSVGQVSQVTVNTGTKASGSKRKMCKNCGKNYKGQCQETLVCFAYWQLGHFKNDCLRVRQTGSVTPFVGSASGGQLVGRVHAMTLEEAQASTSAVRGMV